MTVFLEDRGACFGIPGWRRDPEWRVMARWMCWGTEVGGFQAEGHEEWDCKKLSLLGLNRRKEGCRHPQGVEAKLLERKTQRKHGAGSWQWSRRGQELGFSWSREPVSFNKSSSGASQPRKSNLIHSETDYCIGALSICPKCCSIRELAAMESMATPLMFCFYKPKLADSDIMCS